MIRTRLVPVMVLALSSFTASALAQTKAEPAKPATPAKPAAGAPAKPAEPAKPADVKPAEVKPPAAPTPEQMAEMMKPPAELKNLEWMIGTWKCDGKMKDMMGGGEDIVTKSTAKGKWDLDKHWILSTYEMKKTKTMPGMKMSGWAGYDSSQKKYFWAGVDNWGGMMASWSAGPTNDVWVFEGNMSGMGMQMKSRMTFTKTGDKTMTVSSEMQQGKDWVKMGEDSCKR